MTNVRAADDSLKCAASLSDWLVGRALASNGPGGSLSHHGAVDKARAANLVFCPQRRLASGGTLVKGCPA
jgi:hypothetical protein